MLEQFGRLQDQVLGDGRVAFHETGVCEQRWVRRWVLRTAVPVGRIAAGSDVGLELDLEWVGVISPSHKRIFTFIFFLYIFFLVVCL